MAFPYHPINIIIQDFTKLMIAHIEQKEALIERLLANLETPLNQISGENDVSSPSGAQEGQFVERKFGMQLSPFALYKD